MRSVAAEDSRRGGSRWWIGLLISLAALGLATWGVQPARFLATLRTARLDIMPLILLMQIVGISARARAWQTFLGTVTFRRAFGALNEGYLLNSLLPARLGELARAYLVRKGSTTGTAQALGSVLVERFADVMIALGALSLTLPRVAAPAWAQDIATGVAIGLAVGLAAIVILILSPQSGPALFSRLPGTLGRTLPRLARGLADGLKASGSPRRLIPGAAWLFLGWVVAWLQFELYLRLFGVTGNPTVWLFSLGVIAFGAAVPSSPGAVGVLELAGSAALRAVGYSPEVALGVSATLHLVQIGVTAVLGGWFLSREGQSIGDLARAARDLARRPAEAGG
ncbi:MAG TPA: lysylphosphatidylglycerol synthase transmembrane domain-containing protein [Anaerolineales bacterium]|nr:lysylphosphatidylglycerol synthase transmembrane domain-containing protein [Anaerolineales bacterium]